MWKILLIWLVFPGRDRLVPDPSLVAILFTFRHHRLAIKSSFVGNTGRPDASGGLGNCRTGFWRGVDSMEWIERHLDDGALESHHVVARGLPTRVWCARACSGPFRRLLVDAHLRFNRWLAGSTIGGGVWNANLIGLG